LSSDFSPLTVPRSARYFVFSSWLSTGWQLCWCSQVASPVFGFLLDQLQALPGQDLASPLKILPRVLLKALCTVKLSKMFVIYYLTTWALSLFFWLLRIERHSSLES
jgi:hypothetical protein